MSVLYSLDIVARSREVANSSINESCLMMVQAILASPVTAAVIAFQVAIVDVLPR